MNHHPMPRSRPAELLHAALDGELSADERAEFERLLERDAEAREQFASLQRSDLDRRRTSNRWRHRRIWRARQLARFQLRKTDGVPSGRTLQGEMIMARKTMIGLAAAAAVVLVTFAITGYPPIGKGTEGTIGQANRYQAPQPQLAASDVKLGDTAAQEFMQSDVFDRLIKDEAAQEALSDASVRAALFGSGTCAGRCRIDARGERLLIRAHCRDRCQTTTWRRAH